MVRLELLVTPKSGNLPENELKQNQAWMRDREKDI